MKNKVMSISEWSEKYKFDFEVTPIHKNIIKKIDNYNSIVIIKNCVQCGKMIPQLMEPSDEI